jgi:spermidine synthase
MKSKGLSERKVDEERIAVFCDEHGLRYYNEGIHRSTFAVPTFVKKLLLN